MFNTPSTHPDYRGLGRWSKDFIFGAAGQAGRSIRKGRGEGFVAIVEMLPDAYVELDAESAGHGARLAKDWLRPDAFKGMSASVWRVVDGRLADQLALLG